MFTCGLRKLVKSRREVLLDVVYNLFKTCLGLVRAPGYKGNAIYTARGLMHCCYADALLNPTLFVFFSLANYVNFLNFGFFCVISSFLFTSHSFSFFLSLSFFHISS